MARVFPFLGFRYNKKLVGDLNRVVTQPYDKMTPGMQEEYYRRSPYNVARITLNMEKRKDPDTRYPEAGATLRQWIDQRVLVQDRTPAMYAYYQEYIVEGNLRLQRGFIPLLDLNDSDSGIMPHEHTLAAPKQDRLQLMRSIEGNEDLIYMLYSDETLAVERIMDASIAGRQPEIEVKDEFEAVHRVWAITEPGALKGIQDAMSGRKLFIADGHHRFETSINFMNECRSRSWRPAGTESFDKRMITCFNSAGGVTILATHRLLRDLPAFDVRSFLKSIEPNFAIERLASPDALWKKMKEERDAHTFGFYPENSEEFYMLRLKQAALQDPLMRKHSEAYRELDVSILHALLLERHLGIDEAKLAAQAHIDYARDRESCIRRVREGKYQAAFFLNPPSAEQVQRVALLGGRMPQKSTDFYPKLLTGLIFMKMNIKENQPVIGD
jgi:uncharacterized protein (DUF1015 family)